MKILNQINFSSLLFDTLFGVILFFAIDSLLEIKDPYHFVFYIFSAFILIHRWLIIKSTYDTYDDEVSDSATHIAFGLVYIIFIQYIILMSKEFNINAAVIFLSCLLSVDLIWSLMWRYIGEWKTEDQRRIKMMERELDKNILVNFVFIIIFLMLSLVHYAFPIANNAFVIIFILLYLFYIGVTFKYKLVDIKIF